MHNAQCSAHPDLEIFGRKNNLHNYWGTVGKEATGTRLPRIDIEALALKFLEGCTKEPHSMLCREVPGDIWAQEQLAQLLGDSGQ